jgi:hypothetical protein
MTSTTGINRTSYLHYENAFLPRLVTFNSQDGNNPDITHKHRHSNYIINVKDIDCKPNQLLTAYVYDATIPTTFYQINRFNDTFFIYLPDWAGVSFLKIEKGGNRYSSLEKGVIPIVLSRRNYTTTQLKVEIQKQLDAIVTEYKTSFDVVFNQASSSNVNAQENVPSIFKCKILTSDLNLNVATMNTIGDQTTVQFSNIKTENSGGIPIKDILYATTKYKFNDTVATVYPDASGNTTRPTRIWFGIGTNNANVTEEVWVLSEPRFDVKIQDNGKISIERVDFLGNLPSVNTSEIHRFYLSSGYTNYLHLGLNQPQWGKNVGHLPLTSDFKVNTYNSTGLFDDTRFVGSIMSSHYQKDEFDTPKTTVDITYRQKQYFPNLPMTNALSTIEIRSTRIRANVREKGVHSTVLCKIPITVQQNSFINYVNDNPIRYNLGQGNISLIDINLTDRYGQLLDFNGCPNTISILFETWNIVDIPLNRDNERLTYNNPNARNSKDLHFPVTYDRFDVGMGTSTDYQRENIERSNFKGNNRGNNKQPSNNTFNVTYNKGAVAPSTSKGKNTLAQF